MNILEKVQIGLDLATAISIVGATVTFAYRYSKENKKQRKQRVAEFGSKVIIDDLHSLTDLYRELNEGYRAIPFKKLLVQKLQNNSISALMIIFRM